MTDRIYIPPGRTIERFHASNAFVRGIMGPFGSGKSTACCAEIMMRAVEQRPDQSGVRSTKWAIIRNTYPQLKTTTVDTWRQWVDDRACRIVDDSPIRASMRKKLPDGTTLDLKVLFIALDRPDHVANLLSWELTGAWINEAREVPKEIFDGVTGRVDRYPSKKDGGATWAGVILDTNPPDDEHWWYRAAEEETPKGWEFYKQPGALRFDTENEIWVPNGLAENVKNHNNGYLYWQRLCAGKTNEWIRVYVGGQYGTTSEGKPVYPEYNDDLHASSAVVTMTNQPLIIGVDFGLTPAAVYCQVTPRGRLCVIGEDCADDMGLQQFLRDVVVPRVRTEFKGLPLSISYDPAGDARGQRDEVTIASEIYTAFGAFDAEIGPAGTNDFLPRREAVAAYLTRMVDGKPAMMVSKSATRVRKGFLGSYNYSRIQVSGEARYRDIPTKNKWSHPHDGLQYAALRASGINVRKDRDKDRGRWPAAKAGAM